MTKYQYFSNSDYSFSPVCPSVRTAIPPLLCHSILGGLGKKRKFRRFRRKRRNFSFFPIPRGIREFSVHTWRMRKIAYKFLPLQLRCLLVSVSTYLCAHPKSHLYFTTYGPSMIVMTHNWGTPYRPRTFKGFTF